MANIVKAHILGVEDGAVDAAGRSTQLPEDTWDYQKTGAKEPPYNLDALCVFLEINTWHYRCVKAKAISTAGLGFDFVVPEGVKEPKPENKQILKDFFNHPNDEMTWGEILENAYSGDRDRSSERSDAARLSPLSNPPRKAIEPSLGGYPGSGPLLDRRSWSLLRDGP